MGTVIALDLSGERRGREDKVEGSQDLIGCFWERTGFEMAVEVDTEFVWDKESAKAGAGKIFAKSFLGITEIFLIFFNASS